MSLPAQCRRYTLVAVLCLLPTEHAVAQVVVLHSFTGGLGDGALPTGLIQSGSTFYGTTSNGGNAGVGTVFQIGATGAGFSTLYQFGGPPVDGADPAGLFQSGSTLYGVTRFGGSGASFPAGDGSGTVFQLGTDGSGYAIQHSFTAATTDGINPIGSLVQSGSTLFGVTYQGGNNGYTGPGTIFRIQTDGSGFGVLYNFNSYANGGNQPSSSLLLSGSTLYGTTEYGGSSNQGIVFKINTDGTGFTVLHSFTGNPGEGRSPGGALVLSGSTLFGTTASGGAAGLGTIFEVNTDGANFGVLHVFSGQNNAYAVEGLTLAGSTLYGTTDFDGADALGTLFGIGTDGTDYSVLHSFTGGPGDAAKPVGNLIVSGSNLFGVAQEGGGSNDGVVFSFPIPVPEASSLVLAAGFAFALLARRFARLQRKPSAGLTAHSPTLRQ
jgi:uncharacterized repeat protein (TIGR03803 family)